MIQSMVPKFEQKPLVFGIPDPDINERSVNYADRIGQWYSALVSLDHRKQFGQYFTPVEIADFMASLLSPRKGIIRIVDPGAGTGILSCAVCEWLVSQKEKPSQLILDVCETDRDILAFLQKSLRYLAERIAKKGVNFAFTINDEDFILKYAYKLKNLPTLFDASGKESGFDICISNPPYFKLPLSDKRAQAAKSVVHGQPNIYALFMAVSASLLSKNGELVFITPRSFASGQYFRLFRERFFEIIKPEHIHIFDSRKNAFERYGVLQENIILKARRDNNWQSNHTGQMVTISTSIGIKDIKYSGAKKLPISTVLDIKSNEKILKTLTTALEQEVFEKISSWSGSLNKYGFEISTGPVVAFRAAQFVSEKKSKSGEYAPLLWLQNVRPLQVIWPVAVRHKPQYIKISDESKYLLVPNKNYVLLRRFSAKEENRRLIAAPSNGKKFPSEWIGLENHLNYVYKPRGDMSEEELWGLTVLYNSSLFDVYFRSLNGSTQVGASDIRNIPLPSLDIIIEIGKRASACPNINENIDSLTQLVFENEPAFVRNLVYV